MTDLFNMTTFQIIALHNSLADVPVKAFHTKAIAITRTQKLVDAKAKTDADAAARLEAVAYEAQLAEVKRLQAAEKAAKPAKTRKSRAGEDIGVVIAGPAVVEPATAPKADKPVKIAQATECGLSGTKLALLQMLKRPEGVSEAEGCSALNWAKCTATIHRVVAAAEAVGMTSRRWKGDDKKTRYAVA